MLIASNCDWKIKGTDIAIHALSKLSEELEVSILRNGRDFDATLALAKSLGLQLNVLPKVPHEDLREYYWGADVVFDQFMSGAMGMMALEAIACGRPVVIYISLEYCDYDDFLLKE